MILTGKCPNFWAGWCPNLGPATHSYYTLKWKVNFKPGILVSKYSVMQSNGNSFCGDVVLDSLNMVFSEIEFKTNIMKMFWDLYYKDFIFEEWLKNMHF